MSEVRLDPLTGRSVVIQPARVQAYAPGTLPVVARCPFCPGREEETRQTLAQRGDGADWTVRVFPNNRPGLLPEVEDRIGSDPLHQWRSGVGAHEVVVESRDHDAVSLADQRATLDVVAERLQDLERDTRFAALTWYRNRCVEAGSSQPHPHSQIVATPHVPVLLDAIARSQAEQPGLLQDLAARAGDREVWSDAHVVAFCPWAPVHPLEVCFVPRVSAPHLWASPDALPSLAEAIHRVVAALDAWSGRAPYNLVLFDAPLRRASPGFSWHVRLMPRFARAGGFECWSAGALHPMAPEQAARILRGAASV